MTEKYTYHIVKINKNEHFCDDLGYQNRMNQQIYEMIDILYVLVGKTKLYKIISYIISSCHLLVRLYHLEESDPNFQMLPNKITLALLIFLKIMSATNLILKTASIGIPVGFGVMCSFGVLRWGHLHSLVYLTMYLLIKSGCLETMIDDF